MWGQAAEADRAEFLYRRADIEDVVDAHLLALERVYAIGFGRYIRDCSVLQQIAAFTSSGATGCPTKKIGSRWEYTFKHRKAKRLIPRNLHLKENPWIRKNLIEGDS